MVSISAFITSLATSTLIFVFLLTLFAFLSRRPGNRVIYYPALILNGNDPPDKKYTKRSPFAWIREAWQATEDNIIAIAGLDAAVYIFFFTKLIEILSLTAIFCLPVLIPLAVTDINNEKSVTTGSNSAETTKIDNISMSNIQDKSSRMWAFCIAGYWMSIVTYVVLLKAYKHVIALRTREQSSPKAKPEHFAVLVRDVPSKNKNETRFEQVDSFFRKVHPDSFEKALVVTHLKKAIKLWTELETSKKKLAHAQAVLAINESKNLTEGSELKTVEQTSEKSQKLADNEKGKDLDGTEKKLIETEAGETAKAPATDKPSRKSKDKPIKKSKASVNPRPTHKTGKFGLYGSKVDSIDFYSDKIKELTPLLEEEQKFSATEKEQGAAFVIFNSRRAAAEASQVQYAPKASSWTAIPAPEPREVIWSNLNIGFFQRFCRELVVYTIVFFTVVFYMIPIGLISALTSLDTLTSIVPFIKSITKIKVINSVLQAYLPQVALIVFLALLPKLLMALSKAEGITSRSHASRAAAGKLYYFVVFNVFIGFTIFGTAFHSLNSIKELKDTTGLSASSIISLFGKSVPPNATYFITYIALKFLVGYAMELMRLVPLILYHLKRKYLCKTDQEVLEAWAPGPIGYATNVPNDMLIVTITMCYAVIAPLILPFAIAYFGIGWFVIRNQALNVYVPDFESGGRMWPHMHNRVLSSLFVSQITMIGYFSLRKFPYSFLLIPLPIFTIFFYNICQRVYYPSFTVVSLIVASEEAKEIPTVSDIVDAYTPPCLIANGSVEDRETFDDAEFKDAHSSMTSRSNSGITSPA